MKYITAIVFVFVCLLGNAQEQSSQLEIKASIIKESFYYPSLKVLQGPLHPGIMFGGYYLLKEKEKSRRYLAIETGFFHHEYFQNGVFLTAGYHYRYQLRSSKFTINFQPLAGYIHSFSPTGEFMFEKGRYVEKKSGRGSIMLGLSAGINYLVFPKSYTSIAFSVQPTIEGPFALEWGIPAVPHTFLSLGIKTKIGS